jgi:phosphorylcholine metabolism protein LicD
MKSEMIQDELEMFKATGFFDEKAIAIQHIKDFTEISNKHNIDYCLMFGLLLGLIRHQDFIPWDDDIDIVVFEYDKFIKHCRKELEDRGYIIQPDIRNGKNCGGRIFHKDNQKTIHMPNLGFPWLGIWVPEKNQDNSISFPPEDIKYDPQDFFPLQEIRFMGTKIKIPKDLRKILNTYLGEEDWMEYCTPSILDHRKGCLPTNFPQKKFRLNDVMRFSGESNS